ncbi:MAG: hypothetical protein PHV68_08325, partial [Candidatus Gastranaerophilales bacterium]|nr:hypothetical protein [Candidatus Gastranaerophilales bacterium]
MEDHNILFANSSDKLCREVFGVSNFFDYRLIDIFIFFFFFLSCLCEDSYLSFAPLHVGKFSCSDIGGHKDETIPKVDYFPIRKFCF